MASPDDAPDDPSDDRSLAARLRSWRKWIVLAAALAFFAYLFPKVLDPYAGQQYEEVPHGDHVHYLPQNRDPDVPVSQFPTVRPEPGDTLLPDGQVVPKSRFEGSGRGPGR
jgi:hypothetical protein